MGDSCDLNGLPGSPLKPVTDRAVEPIVLMNSIVKNEVKIVFLLMRSFIFFHINC